MRRRGFIRTASVLIAAAFLSSCAGPARETVKSFSQVGSDKAVLVGRIVLDPPLEKDDQVLTAWGSDSYRNKVYVLTGYHWKEYEEEPGMDAYSGRIEAVFGKTFFVKTSTRSFYVLLGVFFTEISGDGGMKKAYLPGGFKVSVTEDDKAVYIGTIQYSRDEFMHVTGVKVVDDYEAAKAQFEKKFGSKHKLRKALAVPVES